MGGTRNPKILELKSLVVRMCEVPLLFYYFRALVQELTGRDSNVAEETFMEEAAHHHHHHHHDKMNEENHNNNNNIDHDDDHDDSDWLKRADYNYSGGLFQYPTKLWDPPSQYMPFDE
ncbi:uncharacterized protein G2W53_022889 [Senna tora]|uniref:VQ domain-containing protein n=1 Tax=Senna tora TaxID=362788 RepID=A0A834TMU1_9FABA|nr:uncharacterized protein G2W53_022889 [Senna tora]